MYAVELLIDNMTINPLFVFKACGILESLGLDCGYIITDKRLLGTFKFQCHPYIHEKNTLVHNDLLFIYTEIRVQNGNPNNATLFSVLGEKNIIVILI